MGKKMMTICLMGMVVFVVNMEVLATIGDFKIIQLTDNTVEDLPSKISGSNIVWVGHDGNEPDREIFFYDGNTITQIINDDRNGDNQECRHGERGCQIAG